MINFGVDMDNLRSLAVVTLMKQEERERESLVVGTLPLRN